MTDIQRERFKRIASLLQARLQGRGLSPTAVRAQTNGWEGWYSGIARWSKDGPLVEMHSGKWFRRDDAQHFWFGFGSANKSAIEELAEYRSSTGVLQLTYSTDTSESIFSLDDKKRLIKQGGEAQETGAGYNFFGRYDFGFSYRSDAQLAIEASKFIGEIIEHVDPCWDEKQDIAKIKRGGSTEREALVLARRGQGKFRRDVEAIWGACCAVYGCKTGEVLRASHIKPWRDAEDDERLDGENGLLLTATLDALFDKHLISFADSGAMLFSEALSEDERKKLGLGSSLKLSRTPSSRQRGYLKLHRKQSERKWGAGLFR